MSKTQTQKLAGPSSEMVHVATYRRTMPVSLDRMFENALDWEHLPWLHDSSFANIDCEESGPWGWRASVETAAAQGGGAFRMELLLDKSSGTWVSRILEGGIQGSEIWTVARDVDAEHIEVVVDFYMPPGVDSDIADAMGQMYPVIYSGLYDEDEFMMVERERQIQQLRGSIAAEEQVLQIGQLSEIRPQFPMLIDCFGHTVRIVEIEGVLVAHDVVCPHLLGPLADCPIDEGVIQCPWHGYRFDVRTGENQDGHQCRLRRIAEVSVDEAGMVSLRAVG